MRLREHGPELHSRLENMNLIAFRVGYTVT